MPLFNEEEYKKVVNVPMSVIIALFIIIFITTGTTNENSLKGLIGGYLGLLLGVLFVAILNFSPGNLIGLVPFCMIMLIIMVMLYYLYTYFDIISKGDVSGYYTTYSFLSTIFLAAQLIIIFSSVYNNINNGNSKMLSQKTLSLLGLLGVINFLAIIIIGIVLRFYTTQG